MDLSKIENRLMEQKLNEELEAESQQVSPSIANANVVGILFGQREIKFRGQTIGGFWVYGNLSVLPKRVKNIEAGSYISNAAGLPFAYNVRPETVTQFTGLKDKNGKEIYEGDILNGRNRILKIVYWCDKRAAFCESEQFKPIPAKHSFAKLYDKFGKIFNKNGRLENHFIVGNIFENPELLETLR